MTTMNPTDAIGAELSAQTASLRRLARDLVGDPHLAEDVVQDAMHAAIASPPRAGNALVAWLRTVVRRSALDLRRGERRRRQREQLARSPADAAAAATHDEVELMQRVLAAVQGLGEPYRTTVWQRYYGDLSPRAIAAQQGVPLKTVKVRLWRALGQLRQRLDHHYHERRAWLGVLTPLTLPQSTVLLGALVMSVKTKLVFAGVLCAAMVLSVPMLPPPPPTTHEPGAAGAAVVMAAPVNEREPALADEATDRTAVPASAAPVTSPKVAPKAPTVALGGVVLDLEARPVAGVKVVATSESFEPVITDADGRFRGKRSWGSAGLRVDDPRYVTVINPELFDNDKVHDDLTIVVAPLVTIAGIMVDTAGTPVDRADVTVVLGIDLRARLDRALERSADVTFRTWSQHGGRIHIAAPLAPTARMLIEARGHRSRELTVEEARHLTRFVLERTTTGDVLEGIVVDANDQPIAKAVVWLPSWSVVTEPDGTFRINLWQANDLPAGTVPELTAAASGHLQGKLSALTADWRSRSAWPRDVRIRLGAGAEAISGIVRRHDGTPVDGVHVTFAPPEPEQIRPTMFDVNAHFASTLAAQFNPPKPGTFTTAPAVPGSYRLRVFDTKTLDVMLTEPIRTGTKDVELRFPDRGMWPALRGVVVDRRGAPVAGAECIVERTDPHGSAEARLESARQHATTGGVLEFPMLSRDVHTLCVKAAGMAGWQRFAIADLVHGDFRVVVPIGCQARVEVGPAWGEVDQVGLVDFAGNRSAVVFTRGNVAMGTGDIPIQNGRSESFVALDDCIELLLFRDEKEVGRVPIVLRPGETNVLRP